MRSFDRTSTRELNRTPTGAEPQSSQINQSVQSGRPNTLFERQSIVRCRSQTESVTRHRPIGRLRSAIKDALLQTAEQASTRPNQETSTRPTERQKHDQSTSWSCCENFSL